MNLSVPSKWLPVVAGVLLIDGCSEACACENNAQAISDWAECASKNIREKDELAFVKRVVGMSSRKQSLTAIDLERWRHISDRFEMSCGPFSLAVSKAQADQTAGQYEDNVIIVRTPIDALAVHGVIDQPGLPAAKTTEAG